MECEDATGSGRRGVAWTNWGRSGRKNGKREPSEVLTRLGTRGIEAVSTAMRAVARGFKVLVLTAVGAGTAGVVYAQTIEEIAARGVEAAEGRDRLVAVCSERLSGVISIHGRVRGSISIELKRPDKVRLELDLDSGVTVGAFDGVEAWEIFTAASPHAAVLPAALARSITEIADFGGALIVDGERAISLRLVGKESVDGNDAYKIEVYSPLNGTSELFLDARTFLRVRWVGSLRSASRSASFDVRFSDYDLVDGMPVARCVRAGFTGQRPRIQIEWTSVEINPGIDDVWFERPSAGS